MNQLRILYTRLLGYLSVLAILLVMSCEVTDIEPVSDFTDANFWQTRVHAEGAIFGIYDAFQSQSESMLAYGEARGDLMQPGWGFCCGGGAPWGQLQKNEITDANGFTEWGGFYNVINRANVVIEKAPLIVNTDREFRQIDADYAVGEARFLRALAYFWLARVWKDVPLLTEPTTANMDFQVTRTTQAKVLDFVQSELVDIVITNQHLRPQFGSDRDTKTRATIAAGRALLAQVALWRNQYQTVIDQTTAIIGSTLPTYSLVSGSNWYSNFSTGMTTESIFELLYDASQNDRNMGMYLLSSRVGMVPSTYLRDLHESPNNLDYRDNVRGNGRTWVWQNAYFNKWLSLSPSPVPENRVTVRVSQRGDNLADPNFIFFRLADVYLMRAEARNRNGDKEGAIADLNVIRTRAQLPVATIVGTTTELTAAASEDQIEDAIVQERAMELAGEGHRWFDLMRISLRGRPTLLADYVNDGSKYSFSGSWQAWLDPTVRLVNPVSSDPETWYLPILQQNKITNPNLLTPPQ